MAILVIAVLWALTSGRAGGPDGGGVARLSDVSPRAAVLESTGGVTQDDALPEIPGVDHDRLDAFLRPLLERVDPALDGWDTEVIAEEVTKHLKEIGAVLIGEEAPTPAACERLVAAELRVGRLRPAVLAPVFEDASIVVLRPGELREDSPLTRTGSAGMAEALVELREPLQDAVDRHMKFKVVRVDFERADGAGAPGEWTAVALFQASGRTRRGIVQESARWTCRYQRDENGLRLLSLAADDYEEIVPGVAGGVRFADCTVAVLGHEPSFVRQLTRGVEYWRGRLEASFGVDPNGHQGIALGDVNGDGLDDLFVCQQGGLPNRLYVQETDGTLRDVSAAAGVDWMEVTRSALLVDLDNDGDQDLVMAQGWYVMIMANDGSGTFSVTREERSPANIYSVAAADHDNDGDLDLFFCGRNPGREMAEPEGILGTPIPYHDANNGGPNALWENDGSGKFTDVTEAVGLDVNNRRYTFAAAWEDFDNDGDMDLYVANDYGRNNLYRNDPGADGGRRFRDVAAELGVEDISAGMSVAWGDYNNDGLMDIYVSNMFSSAGNRITYQRRFRSEADDATLGHFQRHARGNTLFEARADGGFRDVSVAEGVTMGRWAWGSKFVDLNNDGLEDIYVTNGYLTTEDTGDL